MNPTSTRRTLLKGAAWSAPVVLASSAAPALAASADPCQPLPVTVDWESANYTRLSSTAGVYTIPSSDGSTITLNVTSRFVSMQSGNPDNLALDGGTANDNLKLSNFIIGGTGQRGLVLHQHDRNYQGYDGYQEVTFTFSRQLSTINFQVADIDWVPGDFRDAIDPSSNLVATPERTLALSTNPSFSGYYRPLNSGGTENASGLSNLRLRGSNITSFSLRYANFDTAYNSGYDRDQRVFLTDFDLTVPPIGCP